jgi:hypothetical protein
MSIKFQQRSERLWFVEQHSADEVRTVGVIEERPHGFGLGIETSDYIIEVSGTRRVLHGAEFVDAAGAACKMAAA